MKNALEKQESHLAKLVDLSKQDMLLQLSQTAFQRQTDLDLRKNDKDTSEHLSEINETLKKGLLDKQSNMRGVYDELKKQSKTLEKMSPDRAKEITDKSMGIEQFKTIGERIGDFKEGFKSLFTLKGFLNKTGLVDPNSGGIVSTAINRRDARMQYVNDKYDIDKKRLNNLAQYKNIVDPAEREKKIKEDIGNQFDTQQTIRKDMRKNEKEISRLEKAGWRQDQIENSTVGKERISLAKKMENVDSRVRVAKATPNGGAKAVPAESFSDEAAIEGQRAQEETIALLTKIEENTRPVTGDVPKENKKEAGGNSIFGGILESALEFLKTGFMRALKFIFNPRNILKAFTKVFIPAMIIGSIVNGIVDAFKAFFNGGDFVDVIIAGLGGVLDFLTFGLIDAKSLRAVVDWMGNAADKYIVEPVKKFFSWMGNIFTKYIMDPILEIGSKMYNLLDEYVLTPLANVFKPVTDFFKKIKDQVFGFLEDFGIPEIGFTIPIINKKVSIGPFYPFRPDEGTARVGGNEKMSQSSSASGDSSNYNQNIISTEKGSTNVLQTGETVKDGKATLTQNMATFDPKTGKAYLSGDAGEGEISKRAFRQIKGAAKEGKDSAAISEIIKEDEAYQKLGFFDKLKVDTGFAKATELLEVKKPEVKSGTAVYDKSAQNAQSTMEAQKPSAPVVVNAPTTVSNTSKQNIAIAAPVRNQDPSFNNYLSKTAMVI